VKLSNGYLDVLDSKTLAIDFLSNPDVDVLVLDGVAKDVQREEIAKVATWFREDKENRRFILVSSVQFSYPAEENERLHLERAKSYGWTLEEYKIACQYDEFQNRVLPMLDADPTATDFEEKLAAKYFLAGHLPVECSFSNRTRRKLIFRTTSIDARILRCCCKDYSGIAVC